MKLSSLNQKHEDMLVKYIKCVQGSIYEVTEDSEIHKFLDFNAILENIVEYTNSFNRVANSVNRTTEWAYLVPNLMLYSTIGFLAGIKDKNNAKMIDKLNKELFTITVDFIGETTDILEDIQVKERIQKGILNLKKKHNDND